MDTTKLRKAIRAGAEAMKAYRRNTSSIQPHTSADPQPEAPLSEPPAAHRPEILPPAIIHTSEPDWLPRLTQAYRRHEHVELVDDAALGIDPATQSLLQMGLAGKLTRKEWTAVAVSGGMTVFGAAMIVLAILDPDPTSKLGLLVGSGALLALTGGFQTIRLLTRQKPPNITISAKGIHIDWH